MAFPIRTRARTIRGAEGRRGAALIASLVVVITVAFLGAALIQFNQAVTRQEIASQDYKRAFYMAEAGLAEGFMAVSQGKSGNVGTSAIPAAFGDGVFWVEAEEDDVDRVTLTSIGMCGGGRFALSMVLQRDVNPLTSLGLFSDDDVIIEPGAVIDGFDASKGYWSDQLDPTQPVKTTGKSAQVTSNGDVVIQGGAGGTDTYVFGDVRPGPDGTVTIDPGATVTGSTAPSDTSTDLPAIQTPGGVPEAAPRLVAGGSFTIPDAAYYKKLRVPTGSTVVLQGPVTAQLDQLILDPGATLTLDAASGPIVLYVNEYVDLQAGSTIESTTEDTKAVSVLVGADEWLDRNNDGVVDPPLTIESDGVFHGFLYAPYAALALPGGLRYFGAAAAQQVTVGAGAHVSFDLSMTSDASNAGLPSLITWNIVELPSVAVVKVKLNAVALLEAQGVTPVKAAVAHQEKYVRMTYRDLSSVLQGYDGLATLLDWSQVKRIIKIQWRSTP